MNVQKSSSTPREIQLDVDLFSQEVTAGLLAEVKYLDSKYFYDVKGDALFQEIMNSPEYYLSRCELEILSRQSKTISDTIMRHFKRFNLIELGPGDATKSIHLLGALKQSDANFSYTPIDISKNIIQNLEAKLPNKIRGLEVKGLAGEYVEMLQKVVKSDDSPKVILFLGANIGNLRAEDALAFCKSIHSLLNKGDLLFIGFDLKKDPNTILAAYNDMQGVTRDFNLNLLIRINEELGANFDLDSFEHYPTYDPVSGLCKSYLISKTEQSVYIEKSKATILFKKHEPIFMEVSKKYSIEETEKLASEANFSVEAHYQDTRSWFLDSLWKAE
ncbi:MAG TPA: L-histidine N(alpha)-methyltransferase [Sphingobacteriaceae bacterium]|nr:L-histidine N(alpha)-methyltransferase [Sphingobacteriaceae bacterium]